MANVVFLSQAHLVAAFEKSLGNMTGRLQSLTMTAEQKVGVSKQMLSCRKQSENYVRVFLKKNLKRNRDICDNKTDFSLMVVAIKFS